MIRGICTATGQWSVSIQGSTSRNRSTLTDQSRLSIHADPPAHPDLLAPCTHRRRTHMMPSTPREAHLQRMTLGATCPTRAPHVTLRSSNRAHKRTRDTPAVQSRFTQPRVAGKTCGKQTVVNGDWPDREAPGYAAIAANPATESKNASIPTRMDSYMGALDATSKDIDGRNAASGPGIYWRTLTGSSHSG